jgi:hypothetical protein
MLLSFVRVDEPVARVRSASAAGPVFLRADSGFRNMATLVAPSVPPGEIWGRA